MATTTTPRPMATPPRWSMPSMAASSTTRTPLPLPLTTVLLFTVLLGPHVIVSAHPLRLVRTTTTTTTTTTVPLQRLDDALERFLPLQQPEEADRWYDAADKEEEWGEERLESEPATGGVVVESAWPISLNLPPSSSSAASPSPPPPPPRQQQQRSYPPPRVVAPFIHHQQQRQQDEAEAEVEGPMTTVTVTNSQTQTPIWVPEGRQTRLFRFDPRRPAFPSSSSSSSSYQKVLELPPPSPATSSSNANANTKPNRLIAQQPFRGSSPAPGAGPRHNEATRRRQRANRHIHFIDYVDTDGEVVRVVDEEEAEKQGAWGDL